MRAYEIGRVMSNQSIQQNTIIATHGRLMRLASYASVATAAIIIIMKLGAWLYTDSLSLLASLADSVLDIIVSTINLFAISYALKPADEDHRFGHGKAEDIAALFQAAFIAGAAVLIVVEAIGRFVSPREVQQSMVGIYVMGASTVFTLALVMFQRYVVRQTRSTAITADSLHYMTDTIVNIVVIISLVLTYIGMASWLDPLFALAIAAYILHSGWGVGKIAFDKLMDKEFEETERQAIIAIILQHKEVMGLHDLRTRQSGIRPFIQFHLELDGDMTLTHAHIIADQVESSILKHYPNAEVIIHQDPDDHEDIPLAREGIKALRSKKRNL